MNNMKLRHLADIQNSNVDKIIVPGEQQVRLCNYVDVYKNDFITADLGFNAGSATAAEIARFRVKVGDVIITKDSEDRHDIGIPAYVRETADDLVCGYHLTMLRAFRKRADGAFLFWALQSKPAKEAFAIAANGVTRYGLTQEGIKGLLLWVPDLPTQKRIAGFLDRETARIDELIAKKERLVQMLNLRRIGKIMELTSAGGWEVQPLHRLYWVQTGKTPSRADELNFDTEKGVPWATPADLREDDAITTTKEFISKQGMVGMRPVPKGTILINGIGAGVGKVGVAGTEMVFNQQIHAVFPKGKHLGEMFLLYCLIARRSEIMTYANLNTIPILNGERLGRLLLPIPDYESQNRIVNALDREGLDRRKLVSAVNTSIQRLKEYRASLITAAVTGQIDVDTYGRTGAPSATLERIEEEMQA